MQAKRSAGRFWLRRVVVGVVLVGGIGGVLTDGGWLGSPAFARQAVVTLRDGSRIEGDVTEVPAREDTQTPADTIIIRTRGSEVRVVRANVVSINYTEETELEFNRRHRDLASDDAPGRLELARFALERRRPDLAQTVLREALAIDPNSREGSALYAAAKSQLELERRNQERTSASAVAVADAPPTSPAGASPTTTPSSRPSRASLNPEQINSIKQQELRDGDATVVFKFENDVEKKFASAEGIPLPTFRQLSPFDRFRKIAERGMDAPLLKDVKILRDPSPISEFRTGLQRTILTGCATSNCHGGAPSGNFWLHSPSENEAAMYTNFFILATAGGNAKVQGENVVRPLINRSNPANSLLLQFGLPTDAARTPHLAVPGFKPMFRGLDDQRYKTMLNWIGRSLSPIEPDYSKIDLPDYNRKPVPPPAPPTPPAASQPASKATTQPAGPRPGAAKPPAAPAPRK